MTLQYERREIVTLSAFSNILFVTCVVIVCFMKIEFIIRKLNALCTYYISAALCIYITQYNIRLTFKNLPRIGRAVVQVRHILIIETCKFEILTEYRFRFNMSTHTHRCNFDVMYTRRDIICNPINIDLDEHKLGSRNDRV